MVVITRVVGSASPGRAASMLLCRGNGAERRTCSTSQWRTLQSSLVSAAHTPSRATPAMQRSYSSQGVFAQSSLAFSGTRALEASDVASTSATKLDGLPNAATPSTSPVAEAPAAGETFFSSLIDPLVPIVDALPSILYLPDGLPYAHAWSIVIATIILRTGITLPITLWQRRRTRRMADLVAPQWLKLKETLPVTVAKRCRREKKSYEEYQAELQRELKSQLKALTSEHKCARLPTILVPLAVHVPLFLTISLVLRTALLNPASGIASETVPWWSPPADLKAQFELSAKVLAARGIEGEALEKLTHIQGPTLDKVDKSLVGPLSLGLLSMINVELGQWLRRGMISENEAEKIETGKRQQAQSKRERQANKSQDSKDEEETGVKRVLASEIRAQKQQTASDKAVRREVPLREVPQNADSKEVDKIDLTERRGALLGNVMRTLAIGFVIVSSQAPTGLVLYWLSSAGYTLVQNSFFAFADWRRTRLVQKRV